MANPMIPFILSPEERARLEKAANRGNTASTASQVKSALTKKGNMRPLQGELPPYNEQLLSPAPAPGTKTEDWGMTPNVVAYAEGPALQIPTEEAVQNNQYLQAVDQAQQAVTPPAAQPTVTDGTLFNYSKAMGVDPNAKNARGEGKNVNSEETKTLVNRGILYTPEEFTRIQNLARGMDQYGVNVDPTHPYQQQEQAMGYTNDLLRAYAQNTPTQTDLTPFMSWVNSVNRNGTKVDYNAPKSYAEQVAPKLIEASMKQAAMRGDQNQQLLGALQQAKTGTTTDYTLNRDMDSLIAGYGPLSQGQQFDRRDNADMQRAFRAHQAVLGALRTDKPSQQFLGATQTLGRGLAQLTQPGKLSPQTIQEAQQTIRRGLMLGSGGTSGVGEREKTFADTLGWKWEDFKQFLSGNPADIAKDDKMVEHFKELAVIEQQNLQQQALSRIGAISAGNEWVYEDPRYQNLAKSFESAVGTYGGQYSNIGAAQRPGGQAATNKALANMKSAPSKSASKKGEMTPRQKEIAKLKKELGV